MKRETFFAHKQGIREKMEQNLIWDKYHNTMKHKSSVVTKYYTINIMFKDEDPVDLADKYIMLTNLVRDGVKVKQEEITERPYCTTHTIGVKHTYPSKTIREEISDRQVEIAMRSLVTKKLEKATGRSYLRIDCKVMDLFKIGKIDWDTVVESHKGDCSL